MDPVLDGKKTRSFVGLEVPPVIGMKEPGRYFVLRSNHAGAVDVGSPIYFRQIQTGQVVASSLDPDSDNVTTRIFVRSPYDERVRSNSRFWNASGIDLSLSASGFKLETESLVSMLIGGIAFDQPTGSAAAVADAETVFPLYTDHDAAEKQHFTRTVTWQLDFDQSVRGLAVGAPVEFRGIQIGQVTNVKLYLDEASGEFKIPVLVEIDPERFRGREAPPAESKAFIDRLVATGLRAQLKSGSLLTGQLFVSLDIFENAKPAQVVWNAPIPEFPTMPTPLEEITNNLTRLVERLGKIPVEQIGADLSASLKALRVTLQQSEGVAPALKDTLAKTQTVLESANGLIGPDSTVNTELRRALLELSEAARALGLAADQFQTQPNSLIFGKKGSK
jgi:paraquat-inducible protein B